MSDLPEFGKPWGARGESRPLRFRTPMAAAPGFRGGVLFVQFGDDRADKVHVLSMETWREWVRAVDAVPVPDAEPDEFP